MCGQFRMQNLVLLMASIGMVVASPLDETNPPWRKIAVSGEIVETALKGIEESGM